MLYALLCASSSVTTCTAASLAELLSPLAVPAMANHQSSSSQSRVVGIALAVAVAVAVKVAVAVVAVVAAAGGGGGGSELGHAGPFSWQ